MNYENQILDALMIVSAWDIPDEDFAERSDPADETNGRYKS